MATFIKDRAVIVVGVDYSQSSNDALGVACSLAGTLTDVAIHLVHVTRGTRQSYAGLTPSFAAAAMPTLLDDLQAETTELEALTRDTATAVAAHGTRLFGHLRTGNAAREIVQLASDLSAELIVMGTHGRTAVMKLLLGSVAQSVLVKACCPVLVVRPRGLPRWPEIDPPCTDCLAVQQTSPGPGLWCDRHSQHYARAHSYACAFRQLRRGRSNLPRAS